MKHITLGCAPIWYLIECYMLRSHIPWKKITNWPKCPDQRFDLIRCRLSFIDTVVYSHFFVPSNDYSSLFIQRDVSSFKTGCDAIKSDPNKKQQRFNHTHAHALQCAASFRQFITFIYFYLFFARRFFIFFFRFFFIASTFYLFFSIETARELRITMKLAFIASVSDGSNIVHIDNIIDGNVLNTLDLMHRKGYIHDELWALHSRQNAFHFIQFS